MTDYGTFSPEDLEREYQPRSMVGGDISPFISTYVETSAEARRMLPCREDLAYGPGTAQKLDLFPALKPDAPLFVFIHGGYWQKLSHKESSPMARQVLEAGYAFAAVDYTIAPQGRVEDMVEEVAAALAWLRRMGPTYGYDGERLTVCGHSAGGHLTAMQLANGGVGAEAIEHAIMISGVFDLEPIPQTTINEPLGLTSDRAKRLSPMFMPPTVLPRVTVAVAENDTKEFIRQSRDYTDHMSRHGAEARYELLPGLNHFDAILDVGFALDTQRHSGP